MTKILFLFSFFLAGYTLTAQTFTVGSTCCNYHLVNKAFICTLPWSGASDCSDSLPIDIDGDLVNDVVIKCRGIQPGTSHGASDRAIFITSPSNVQSSITFSSASSTYNINNLNYGDAFNLVVNWQGLPVSVSNFNIFGSAPISVTVPVVYEDWSKSISSQYYTSSQQTNPFYIAFRKILPSNDTICGWINIDSNWPGKVIDYAYTCGSFTGTPQSSTIITSPSVVQKCDSVQLSGAPAGGVFYGPGVSGNYFKTKNLAAGIYAVSYGIPNTTGCATIPTTITFTVTSPIAFTSTQTTSCIGESLTLTAVPAGGTFTGYYISGNIFAPASGGTFTANYSYSNAGCHLTAGITLSVSNCVGIKENENINSNISIFPNPTCDKLTISINNFQGSGNYTLKLITVEGKILRQKTLISVENEEDVSNISSGIYFIEINHNNMIVRKKLVINR